MTLKAGFLDKHFYALFYGGFFAGLALAFIYAGNQILSGDQTQMLYKGYLGAMSGSWLSYGNAASAVGNVPGSLSAYLVGLPLLLWDSPYAPMYFLIALRIVSFFLFDAVIKQVFAPKYRLLFLLLYWLNPWFLFETILYNPSYLLLFAAMHFWSAWNMRDKASFTYSFIHLLSIGMAMQLHYSWPILAVISAYLFYRKLIKVQWLGLIAAALVIMGSLLPYFMELMHNQEIAKNTSEDANARYIGWGGVHVYPVLKAVLYWLRYASWIFTNKLIMETHFEWLSQAGSLQLAATYLWRALVFAIGALSMWLAFKANQFAWRKLKGQLLRTPERTIIKAQDWLLLYAAAAFLAVLISAALSPIIFSYWHLLLAFPSALIPLQLFISHWADNNPGKFTQYWLIAVVYLLVVNLLAAHDSEKFSYKVNYKQQTQEYIKQLN